jgi:hypothetical protein
VICQAEGQRNRIFHARSGRIPPNATGRVLVNANALGVGDMRNCGEVASGERLDAPVSVRL